MTKKSFSTYYLLFFFFSVLFLILILDFVFYVAMGLMVELLVKSIMRAFVIQSGGLVIATIILIRIFFPLNKIINKDNFTDSDKTEILKFEKKAIILIVIIDIIGLSFCPILAIVIRFFREGFLFWSTLRFGILTIISGPSIAIIHILFFNYLFEKIKTQIEIYEFSYEKRYLNLKMNIIYIFIFFSFFCFMSLFLFVLTREEKLAGISLVAISLDNKEKIENNKGYFSNLLNLAQNSNDIKVKDEAKNLINNWESYAMNSVYYISFFSSIIFLFFIFFILIFATNISTHLKGINKKLAEISKIEGDFTKFIIKTRDDEIGELQILINQLILNINKKFMKINEMIRNVILQINKEYKDADNIINFSKLSKNAADIVNNEIINQIKVSAKTSNTIKEAVILIESNMNDILSQQAMIEETSASLTQMTASIQSVSKATTNANNLSNQLKTALAIGISSIEEMKESIDNISTIGVGISDIVSTISSITEQTDILAMNASIEAAHAGDAGKGFSVVADEIRKLAENTAGQTKEITSLLRSMTNAIKLSVSKSEKMLLSMDNISKDIELTTNIIGEINNSAKEQSIGAGENIKAIQLLVDITTHITDNIQKQKNINESFSKTIKDMEYSSINIEKSNKEAQKYYKELDINVNQFYEYFNSINKSLKTIEDILNTLKFTK